ncbi:MAG: preprotein translocase subunit SecE [Cyanobacteriota bacterium]
MVAKSNDSQPVSKKKGKKAQVEDPSVGEQLKEYFKGVRSEWHKITWPDKQQTWHETLVVIVVTAIITLLIYIIDVTLRYIIGFIPGN